MDFAKVSGEFTRWSPSPAARRQLESADHVGLRNFHRLYRPLAASWRMYDNAGVSDPQLVARGTAKETIVVSRRIWDSSLAAAGL